MDIQKTNLPPLPPAPKPPTVNKVSPRHKVLADNLRGNRSYKEHYAYLLDWYSNDRNGFHIGHSRKTAPKVPNIVVADNHVKKTFNDVLESIKHLDSKIERVSRVSTDKEKTGIKVEKTSREGNIFTRLVDGRRFQRK